MQNNPIFIKRVDEFCSTLLGRELIIFTKRTISDKPLTLKALGKELGLSIERVRQIEDSLINRFRIFIGDELMNLGDPVFR